MSSLVYECGMDKFPKIKMVVVHGDGLLPYYPKRQDMAFRDGRDGAKIKGDFSSYIPKF
mgnify:CR=1 FL=1